MDFFSTRTKVTLFFLISTALFSMASPILKLLIEQGRSIGLTHPNAISFCNVLFVGNFCAGLITYISFPKHHMLRELTKLNKKTWALLLLSSFIAVLYPSCIFIALEKTTVTRVVLISRFEGIFYALIMLALCKQKLSAGSIVSYVIITIGVCIALFSDGMLPSKADFLILIAAFFYGISEYLSSLLLDNVTMPTFIFFRNLVSAIMFFIIATYLFGIQHFADLFHGDLWLTMFFYALITIIIGQFLWFKALQKGNLEQATNFALVIPYFTLFFAWILLGQIPHTTEWIALAFIALGMIMEKLIKRLKPAKLQQLGPECGLVGR